MFLTAVLALLFIVYRLLFVDIVRTEDQDKFLIHEHLFGNIFFLILIQTDKNIHTYTPIHMIAPQSYTYTHSYIPEHTLPHTHTHTHTRLAVSVSDSVPHIPFLVFISVS